MDTKEPAGGQYLALPSFDGIGNTIITLLGNVAFIILVVRIFAAWAQRRWGEIIAEAVAAIFIFWFVWFPDNAKATLKELAHQVFG